MVDQTPSMLLLCSSRVQGHISSTLSSNLLEMSWPAGPVSFSFDLNFTYLLNQRRFLLAPWITIFLLHLLSNLVFLLLFISIFEALPKLAFDRLCTSFFPLLLNVDLHLLNVRSERVNVELHLD